MCLSFIPYWTSTQFLRVERKEIFKKASDYHRCLLSFFKRRCFHPNHHRKKKKKNVNKSFLLLMVRSKPLFPVSDDDPSWGFVSVWGTRLQLWLVLFAYVFTSCDQLIHFLFSLTVHLLCFGHNWPVDPALRSRKSFHGIGRLWIHSVSFLTMPGRSFVVYQPLTPKHAAMFPSWKSLSAHPPLPVQYHW